MRESLVAANGKRVALERRVLPKKTGTEDAPPVADPAVAMAGKLEQLLDRLRRLMPLNSDPERFHEEKSEICKGLADVAGDLRRQGRAPGQWGTKRS